MTATAARRYGVVGQPVDHSLSPRIHAAFARQTGRPVAYDRICAPLAGFARTVAGFFADGGCGLNVTLPFKLEAHALCGPRVSPRATRARAVNWLAPHADGISGDNTDGIGLVRDLQRLLGAAALADARIVLVGAGGAARGVLGPLHDALHGAPRGSIRVAARDATKAVAMIDACGLAGVVAGCGFDALAGTTCDLVVNATSASLAGARLPLPSSLFADAPLAYDMMYGPAAAAFLDAARDAGARATADGLGMLVEQAAESFWLWHGVMPEAQPVIDELRG